MYQTANKTDLFFRIYKIHHKGDTHVACRMMFFYKSSKDICYWTNPEGKPKNFKIIRKVYDSYRGYDTEKGVEIGII